MTEIRQMTRDFPECKESAIAPFVAILQDARKRTKNCLLGLKPSVLNWREAPGQSSIGDLLYHIALVEADWLYVDVLGIAYPKRIAGLLPHPDRGDDGALSHVQEDTLQTHVARMDDIRGETLGIYCTMDLANFHRLRSMPTYDVSPEWVIHHLAQHEAEHRGMLKHLRTRAEALDPLP